MEEKGVLGKDVGQEAGYNKGMIWPLYLVAIVPLLVMGHVYDSGLGEYTWFGSERQIEFYNYYKMLAVIIIACIMLVKTIIYRLGGGEFKKFVIKDWIQWGTLAGYLILMFLSTCFSEYSFLGFKGGFEQFESVWAVIGYAIIAFYAFMFISNEREVIAVLNSQAVSAGIIGIIGVAQAYGHDIFKSDIVKRFITLGLGKNGEVVFNLPENMTYATLYNPNYVGVYSLLMIPILVYMMIVAQKLWQKLIYAVEVILLFVSMIGSGSKTGVIVLAVLAIMWIIFQRRLLIRNWKLSLPILIIAIIGVTIIFATRGGKVIQLLKNAVNIQKNDSTIDRDFITSSENVALRGGDEWIYISIHIDDTQATLSIAGEDGYGVNYTQGDNGEIILKDEAFEWIQIKFGYITDEYLGFIVNISGVEYYFIYDGDEYLYYTGEGKYSELDTTEVEVYSGLEGYEHIATGRGYIWSRTIPLLKDTVVFGNGRDSFTCMFPNNDVFEKWEHGYIRTIITKPHNIYLQLMCQDGILGTILCLISVLMYMFNFLKNRSSRTDLLQNSIFITVIGFAIAGLINDSYIGITPIFWLFVGIGIRTCKESKKNLV